MPDPDLLIARPVPYARAGRLSGDPTKVDRMPGWPWPDDDVLYYATKARRALRHHEHRDELCRAALIWLALCGIDGQPLVDLRGWAESAPLGRLREWIVSFEAPGPPGWPTLRAWVESQVGYRTASLPAQRRRRLRWVGMRTR